MIFLHNNCNIYNSLLDNFEINLLAIHSICKENYDSPFDRLK